MRQPIKIVLMSGVVTVLVVGIAYAVAPAAIYSSVLIDTDDQATPAADHTIAFQEEGTIEFRDGGLVTSAGSIEVEASNFAVNTSFGVWALDTDEDVTMFVDRYIWMACNDFLWIKTNDEMVIEAEEMQIKSGPLEISSGGALDIVSIAEVAINGEFVSAAGGSNILEISFMALGDFTEGEYGDGVNLDGYLTDAHARVASADGDAILGTVNVEIEGEEVSIATNSAVICTNDGDVVIQLGSSN